MAADDDAVVRALADWADVARQVLAAPAGQDALDALQSYVLKVTKLTRPRLSLVIEQQFGAEAMKKFVSTYDQIKLEGKAEGKAEGRAELLRRLLERRFGALPRDVSARLANASIDDLDRWALRMLDARELASVFADPFE